MPAPLLPAVTWAAPAVVLDDDDDEPEEEPDEPDEPDEELELEPDATVGGEPVVTVVLLPELLEEEPPKVPEGASFLRTSLAAAW